ncbi:MAG: cation transporter [Actinomycetales bacterium]
MPVQLDTPGFEAIELAIGGMTCASCAARVEKRLNRLDGVVATVNYATEKAKVTFDASTTPDSLVAEVEKAGYTATLPAVCDLARHRKLSNPQGFGSFLVCGW